MSPVDDLHAIKKSLLFVCESDKCGRGRHDALPFRAILRATAPGKAEILPPARIMRPVIKPAVPNELSYPT
jgi:hypothetical protein